MIFLMIFYMYIKHLHNSNQISFPYGHLLLIAGLPADLENLENLEKPGNRKGDLENLEKGCNLAANLENSHKNLEKNVFRVYCSSMIMFLHVTGNSAI